VTEPSLASFLSLHLFHFSKEYEKEIIAGFTIVLAFSTVAFVVVYSSVVEGD
jgi:hypothetical protein